MSSKSYCVCLHSNCVMAYWPTYKIEAFRGNFQGSLSRNEGGVTGAVPLLRHDLALLGASFLQSLV